MLREMVPDLLMMLSVPSLTNAPFQAKVRNSDLSKPIPLSPVDRSCCVVMPLTSRIGPCQETCLIEFDGIHRKRNLDAWTLLHKRFISLLL